MNHDSLATGRRLTELIETLVSEHAAARRAVQSGARMGAITGLESLDSELGGFLAPGVHVLQAAPGIGKTALALQVSQDCGVPSVYVFAEMALLEIFRRIIARCTGTRLDVLKSPSLSEEQLEKLATAAAEKCSGIILVDATSRRAPPEAIVPVLDEVSTESGAVPLLVIDSLQAWARGADIGGTYASDYEVISRGVRVLLDLAAGHRVPVLGITQRNRAGQERGGLFAAKGTGDIEYCAESVLEMHREADAYAGASGENEVTLSILKNRHGSAGAEISLAFNGPLQTFRQGFGQRRRR